MFSQRQILPSSIEIMSMGNCQNVPVSTLKNRYLPEEGVISKKGVV